MLHAFKTPIVLAASLALVAACSSSPSDKSAISTATKVSPVAGETALPKAGPLDLALLASLAGQGQESGTAIAQKLPSGSLAGAAPEPQIAPATVVTYQSEDSVEFNADAGYPLESLIVVPHDSDLLEGTAYESGAALARRKPIMNPGTYRTIEYK